MKGSIKKLMAVVLIGAILLLCSSVSGQAPGIENEVDKWFDQAITTGGDTIICQMGGEECVSLSEAKELPEHRQVIANYLEWEAQGQPNVERQVVIKETTLSTTYTTTPTLVYSDPDYDGPTHIASPYVQADSQRAAERGYNITYLWKEQCIPETFNPAMITGVGLGGVGHGGACFFTGYQLATLLTGRTPESEALIGGKWYWPATCDTGYDLGPWIGETGGVALAYYGSFWACGGSIDLSLFFETHYTFSKLAYYNWTAGDAYNQTLTEYESAVEEVSEYCRPYLVSNYEKCRLFGQTGATLPQPPFQVPLGAGWNILSTPVQLDSAYDELGQILTPETQANLISTLGWDPINQQWVTLTTTYQLLPLKAVYVRLSASGTAIFVPSRASTSVPTRALVAGLNLIGPAPAFDGVGFPAMPLDQALVSIKYAPGGLRGYTMVISPGLNQPGWTYALGGTIRDLLPYKGYWVVMENPGALQGFSMTPLGRYNLP